MNEEGKCGKVERLLRQAAIMQAEAVEMIKEARQHCKHPNKTGSYGSNTGNWCEADDCYWIDIRCPDCGWSVTIYNDNPEYRMYSEYAHAPEGYRFKRIDK